jgi:HEAT repeat protein
MRSLHITSSTLAVGLLALSSTPAFAQRTRPATPPASSAPSENSASEPPVAVPTLSDLPQLTSRLASGSPEDVANAIDQLLILDRPESVPPLAALIRSGQPADVTDHALDALRAIAEPSAMEVLSELTHHRRSGARRRAYTAIAATRDPRSASLVEQGLRDSDRAVRSTCATALGAMQSRSSIEILFRAFERGVVEAAAAIGKLGDERSVARFGEHLGQQPLSVMLSGYEQYLRRADIDERTKTAIVNQLGEVSGSAVRDFLTVYLNTLPEPARRAPPRRIGATDNPPLTLRELVARTIRQIRVEPLPQAAGAAQ